MSIQNLQKGVPTEQSNVHPLTLDGVFTFDNVFKAYLDSFKGKRLRPRYFSYSLNLGMNIYSILESVANKTFTADPPVSFTIFCNCGQKTRIINASSVKDVITQRTLYNALYPVFDKSFIFDSYGCRKGKGPLKAGDRVQFFMRHSPEDSYYLQLDVRKFYYNVDHNELRQELSKKIHDIDLLNLCMQFVGLSPNENSYIPYAPNVGLDVGAMISQLYGLIYLNRLDHFIKRTLRVKHYARYVDDMVIIGESKDHCLELKEQIEQFLWSSLKLKLSCAIIQPLKAGINFAGYRTWRQRRLVRKFSIRNFHRKLKKGKVKSLQSHLAHSRYTASFGHLAQSILDTNPDLINQMGGVIKDDLLKYQANYKGGTGDN